MSSSNNSPTGSSAPRDTRGRPLESLRLSVTDRCNLRCAYCMPHEDYTWIPHEGLLSYEEIERLVGVFTSLGVDRVRLTGGEPLLRRDLAALVRLIAAEPLVKDVALTTNGLLLEAQAEALKQAGLDRLTISLDTLRADRFFVLARRHALERTLHGLAAADAAGFTGTKLDTVVMRGRNDDELADLVTFAAERGYEARFIEYMDVGGATGWRERDVVSRDEMLARLTQRFGPIEALPKTDTAPADRFQLRDGTVFGIIASTTRPFCGGCDRSRLTADGHWFLCLYAGSGTDLRGPLRGGAPDEELARLIAGGWQARADRGAEERLELAERGALVSRGDLLANPHLEMHTKGG